MASDARTVPRELSVLRMLDLVWLVPVLLATAVTLVTAGRLEVVAPLLAVALVPWFLLAARRALPEWLFGLLAIGPVAGILVVEGLDASVFLGTTALSLLASRAARPWHLASVITVAIGLPFLSALGPPPFDLGSIYFAIGDLFGVAVGVLLGYSIRLAADLRRADARLVAVRAQEERTALARDVHDLVAHSLTVVVLHIGGARRIVRSDPAQAELALEQAEATCREGLDGIRRVVGLLRTDDDPVSPSSDLNGLVGSYRDAGVSVEVDIDGRTDGLPLFVRSLLQRVAQEALANAARYRTPESAVRLAARVDPAGVLLTVTNAASPKPHATAGGYGLVGLREQVVAAGGTLSGRYADGRWSVECRLPVVVGERERRATAP